MRPATLVCCDCTVASAAATVKRRVQRQHACNTPCCYGAEAAEGSAFGVEALDAAARVLYVGAIQTKRSRPTRADVGGKSRADRIKSGPDIRQEVPAPELQIGQRLRRARLAGRMTLDDVARATGLTKGFISQLERDMTSASVASLVKVCEAVQISVGTLFEPAATSLTRSEEAPRINFGGSGLCEMLLTPRGSSDLQIIRSVIEPGGGSGEELYGLDAKAEVAYVIDGELVVVLDAEEYRLGAGDTLTFSALEPHAWYNPSKQRRTVALWILAPSPW